MEPQDVFYLNCGTYLSRLDLPSRNQHTQLRSKPHKNASKMALSCAKGMAKGAQSTSNMRRSFSFSGFSTSLSQKKPQLPPSRRAIASEQGTAFCAVCDGKKQTTYAYVSWRVPDQP